MGKITKPVNKKAVSKKPVSAKKPGAVTKKAVTKKAVTKKPKASTAKPVSKKPVSKKSVSKKGKPDTQNRVEAYIRKHGYITPFHSITELGIVKLNDAIRRLRKKGLKIRTSAMPVKLKTGEVATFTRYSFK